MTRTVAVASLALVSFATTAAAQKGGPAWTRVDSAIRADFARHDASAKILEITQGDHDLWPWWVAYEADVSVERSGGRRDKERIGVSYVIVKGKWELDEIELLGSRQLADVKPPSEEEAQKLLTAAWPASKCQGYDITRVTIDGAPRFQRDPNATDAATAKRSYIYSVDVLATGNGQFRMSDRGTQYTNSTQNLLTWNADSKSWSVDPRQLRCAGWIKQEAQVGGATQQQGAPDGLSVATEGNPSDADVVQVFTRAWGKLRPDFTVTSITLKSKDPHQSGDKKWVNYKLSIMATGTDQGSKSMAGKKYLCEPADYSSVLKYDAAAKLWKVDESAVKDFNESSCTPKG